MIFFWFGSFAQLIKFALSNLTVLIYELGNDLNWDTFFYYQNNWFDILFVLDWIHSIQL